LTKLCAVLDINVGRFWPRLLTVLVHGLFWAFLPVTQPTA